MPQADFIRTSELVDDEKCRGYGTSKLGWLHPILDVHTHNMNTFEPVRYADWPSEDAARVWCIRAIDGLVRCAISVPDPGSSNPLGVAYGKPGDKPTLEY